MDRNRDNMKTIFTKTGPKGSNTETGPGPTKTIIAPNDLFLQACQNIS